MSVSMCNSSEIPNRLAGPDGFKGKTLLVTGATGFLGKVFVEKMLRTCPLVETIYVIIRVKKGKRPEDRLQELFSSPLFDLLKKTRGLEIFRKVVAIDGDISQIDLGLSEANRSVLTSEVEVIYHIAATVRFDEPLQKAVHLNTRGTKLLLELARDCKKLMVFVHISTAYSQWCEEILYDKTYLPPADPHHVIKAVEAGDEALNNIKTKEIMGNCPNTYIFTKALAEGLVNDEMDKLPVIIVRPSVVMPMWKDPIPGWVDNLNGPIGSLIAIGKGVLRTFYCKTNVYLDYIPVDIAANGLMIAGFDYLTNRERRVYNLTTSSVLQITIKDGLERVIKIMATNMPFNWGIWHPNCLVTSSRWLYNFWVVIFHFVPAAFVDLLLVLMGRKPGLWLIQQKILKHFRVLEVFTCRQWNFDNVAMVKANELLNEAEQVIYNVEVELVDQDDYAYNYVHGLRLFVLKESDKTLPTARRHMNILWFIDRLCKIGVLLGVGYLLQHLFL